MEVAPVNGSESRPTKSLNVVSLRRVKLDSLLGHEIPSYRRGRNPNSSRLWSATTDAGWTATSPSWRFDIAIEQDLIEEVGRIYDYDNIPNQAPKAALKMNDHKEADQPLKRVRDLLVDRGYHEAITYSFVEPRTARNLLYLVLGR